MIRFFIFRNSTLYFIRTLWSVLRVSRSFGFCPFQHVEHLYVFEFDNPLSFIFTDPLASLFAVVIDSRLKWLVSSFTITPKSLSSIRDAHCALRGGRPLSLSSGGFCVGQATHSAGQVPLPLQSWGLVPSSPLIIHRLAFCHQSSMTL